MCVGCVCGLQPSSLLDQPLQILETLTSARLPGWDVMRQFGIANVILVSTIVQLILMPSNYR